MESTDISVIITAHSEGILAAISAKSALEALALTRAANLTDEVIVVLDKATDLTVESLRTVFGNKATYLTTNTGDPGLSRNKGIEAADGYCSCFLDADDLWSENWLIEAWKFIEKRPDTIAQSACNMVFGNTRLVFWHTDSETAIYDSEYLAWLNYWDSLSFARTEIYRQFPFRANDLKLGFGHEDWHFAKVTTKAGIPHKPVPGTMHFKRAREGSQMSKVDAMGGVSWPLTL